MTAAPEDQGAADHGGLRASDADRDQVVDVLKAAFVQGRLTRDELEIRTALALTSRTYGELAAVTAALPAAPAGAAPAGAAPAGAAPAARVGPRRPAAKKAAAWAAGVIVPPALAAAFFTFYGGFLVLFLLTFIAAVVTTDPVRSNAQRRW